MYPLVKHNHRILKPSVAYCVHLIDQCFSLKSWKNVTALHAQLIKVGFNRYTFLGNRCVDLYCRFGSSAFDAVKVFDEITFKNVISWNICLKGLVSFGHMEKACEVFGEIPERDVVSWNSVIVGHASCGHADRALEKFREMQISGIRPSEYTYSILMSVVSTARHVKELHGNSIRCRLTTSNVVVGNSLIDLYGNLGLPYYALSVFLSMEETDVISWNSLITCFCKSGRGELALNSFCLMRSLGHTVDAFTLSAIINCCSDLRKLNKGKQILALSMKLGFLCNSLVSSAAIHMFSKCNRFGDSVKLFEELEYWDSAVCSTMISCYTCHRFTEEALRLFVLTLREDIRPTEFTFSSMLSSVYSFPSDQGTQIHSLVVKLGYESDAIVASSLVDMYSKYGLVDYAMEIFLTMTTRDLTCWNTLIMGLSHNSKVQEAVQTFEELLRSGPPPDRITFFAVLLACTKGGFIDEGISLFSSMVADYGITPGNEHFSCLVNLLCQAGRLDEAVRVIKQMPYEPGSLVWESLLYACSLHLSDPNLLEGLAVWLMDIIPEPSLPYLLLARIYEKQGRWESLLRLKNIMKGRVKEVVGFSWIGIKNRVYLFDGNELEQHGGTDVYSSLSLLSWEMEDKDAESKNTMIAYSSL
ncbi:Pentatricopeptide repeat-containing protein At1g43980, mitochondrial [Linum perenne]